MKTQNIALLGVAAIAAYFILSKSTTADAPYTYNVPPTEEQRWSGYPTTINDPKLVYANPLSVNLPVQALIRQAIGVRSWTDIPTAEEFKVYSVDKGNYTEYYYTL